MAKRPKTVLVADYDSRFIWFDSNESFNFSRAFIVIQMLRRLEDINHEPIVFYIRNGGGDFYAFIKVAHVIESMESPVKFVPFDFVRSGAFWISQCGFSCFPMPKTRFKFHRAVQVIEIKNKKFSQLDCLTLFDKLKLVDSFQFWVFTRKGAPASKITDLFLREATIFSGEAIKLKLAQGLYKKRDFKQDKKRAMEIAREKYKF